MNTPTSASSVENLGRDSMRAGEIERVSLGLISVGAPIYFGIYARRRLVARLIIDELPLVALPRVFEGLLGTFSLESLRAQGFEMIESCYAARDLAAIAPFCLESIYYARGPGSFTSLKLTHIFLHTLALLHNVRLFGGSSFAFSSSRYIKAFGTTYFYCAPNGEIRLCAASDMPHLGDDTLREKQGAAERGMIKREDKGLGSVEQGDINQTGMNQGGFFLPLELDTALFSTDTTPLYILPAV